MKYAIWDKVSNIITPIGEELTAEQWMNRYPIARNPNVKIVCGGGIVNGSFFGIFDQMIEMYQENDCNFSGCNTDEDYLRTIEEFENNVNKNVEPSAEERIASALEFQVMMSLPDEEIE